MANACRFIEERLNLKVNRAKSAVDRPRNRRFLGYSFFRHLGIRLRVAPKSFKRFKARIREITARSNGWSIQRRIAVLNRFIRGWMQYFRLAQNARAFEQLDKWILRRLRLCQWKQWKRPRTPLREPRPLGLQDGQARAYWKARGVVGLAQMYQSCV